MIKLIASDMDGTLLDENSIVPPETYRLIEQLHEKGIHFAVASGRRYDTLYQYMEPVADKISFVAGNGAQVYVDGNLVDLEVFSTAALRRLKVLVDRFDCLHLALFDSVRTYLFDDVLDYNPELDKDLPHIVLAERLPNPRAAIVKCSIYCDQNPMDMAYVLSRELEDDFVFAPSGHAWIDVMQRGVSKATGIQQVMDHYNVKADEVMAFGDSMNDYEILRMVGDGCAMENGRYAIKQICSRTIEANSSQGVQKELARLLKSLQE